MRSFLRFCIISELLFLCHIPADYLISLCTVCLRRTGLYFFSSIRSVVVLRFFVVTYLELPGFSVHSNMTCILFPFAMGYTSFNNVPSSLPSLPTAWIPHLLMLLSVLWETLRVTDRSS